MGHIDHARMPDHKYIEKTEEAFCFFRDYRECLAKLTKKERNVLTLYYDRNMRHSHTIKEISQKLGICETTVKKLKKSGMDKIKNDPLMQKYRGLFG